MEIKINNKNYIVNKDEFVKINTEYTERLLEKVGYFETLYSFINEITNLFKNKNKQLKIYNTTHGGFLPINCSEYYDYITMINTEQKHYNNILENIKFYKIKNILFNNEIKTNINLNNQFMVYLNILNKSNEINEDIYNSLINNYKHNKIIYITNCKNYKNILKDFFVCYEWTNLDLLVFVDIGSNQSFLDEFYYYIKDNNNNIKLNDIVIIDNNINNYFKLVYDNLNNLCIMVKNAGPQFEKMLIDNIDQFDRWTILDTGSTDNTINIINKILVNKKKGNLYQEPFINFRDSRNRLLDLAGTTCKFNVMLDDTYVIQGNLRNYLNIVRGDQYSDSYTIYIQSYDNLYGSNRIIKSLSGLRYIYTIHEIINDKNNINVLVPLNISKIEDKTYNYMEKRTLERKQLDLKLLYNELINDPNNPRNNYYLAQTYYILKDYEKAFYYFNKRSEDINIGFFYERYDAMFECARFADIYLKKPWDECYKLYNRAINLYPNRADPYYFIGIHYFLENNLNKAYEYFKIGFNIGFTIDTNQYSLKPTLNYHFLPKYLTRCCYQVEDYILGEKCSHYFLLNNSKSAEHYQEMISWNNIYKKLNFYKKPIKNIVSNKNIFCFVADGGFNNWSGTSILKNGVGGSETYIIEMARYIKKYSNFDVYVFCNTPNQQDELFEGVYYKHLNSYYEFINTHYVKHCVISRYSEYLPLSFKGLTENVYYVVHDLIYSGIVIPIDHKLKNIFCLSEWHVKHFNEILPHFKNITVPFYYGIDDKFKQFNTKIQNKFIYSSFPNRGLLELLQMWPKIYEKDNTSTLHIYSDINNEWSNNTEPNKMLKIKDLLNLYKNSENNLGIYYHGWVSKKELANAWSTSDIWFYPCTFMETFCLTSLEAASSKTLCITNDLAALNNTVGNRGIIIKGDTTTNKWQQQALEKLFYIMDDINKEEKYNFININYDWAKTLSWDNQAKKFLEQYIYPNNIFEYKGMYNWTNNLGKDIFLNIIHYFNNNYHNILNNKNIKILEIGTYSGMSIIELVKLIPNSYGTAVDMWSNYNENNLLSVIDNYDVKGSFYKNLKNANLENKIMGIQSDSTSALIQFIKVNNTFDFIYVDGSHLLLDCYTDLFLSWQLLEKNGILAIDDYLYKKEDDNILNSPYEAINHFLKIYNGKYKVLHIGYRVFLEKLI